TTRSATAILAEQSDNVGSTLEQLQCLKELAGAAVLGLRKGELGAVGHAMRESWGAKRKLASGVSNQQLDTAVQRALAAGASGAKITGAGGGGFLLVICEPENQRAVRRALGGMRELPVKLDRLGSRVVFNVMRDIWS
ncbi:MAG TPA: galactokinase, partial [Acidimicrobiales bacterium]|nr:galactokinase [Acidimicrobiales bacterium]